MSSRITVDQLEQMRTHELADLLTNIVLVLRRMPDVACKDLQPPVEASSEQIEQIQKATKKSKKDTFPEDGTTTPPAAHYSQEELVGKNVTELRRIARELQILGYAKAKKEELVGKIMAKQERSHSEQFAIGNL